MKTLKTIAAVALLVLSTFASRAQDTECKDVPDIITIYVKLKAEGLNCMECADRLERQLKKIDGAKDIKVYLQAQIAVFQMPSDRVISEKELKKIVLRAGFMLIWVKYDKEEFEKELDEIEIM